MDKSVTEGSELKVRDERQRREEVKDRRGWRDGQEPGKCSGPPKQVSQTPEAPSTARAKPARIQTRSQHRSGHREHPQKQRVSRTVTKHRRSGQRACGHQTTHQPEPGCRQRAWEEQRQGRAQR